MVTFAIGISKVGAPACACVQPKPIRVGNDWSEGRRAGFQTSFTAFCPGPRAQGVCNLNQMGPDVHKYPLSTSLSASSPRVVGHRGAICVLFVFPHLVSYVLRAAHRNRNHRARAITRGNALLQSLFAGPMVLIKDPLRDRPKVVEPLKVAQEIMQVNGDGVRCVRSFEPVLTHHARYGPGLAQPLFTSCAMVLVL